MKNLSIDTWKSLDLPINLYYVLNELYQSALSEQQASQPKPNNSQNNINNINNYQPYNPPNQYSQYQTQPQPQIQQQKQNINQKINNNINQNNSNSLQNIVHNDLSILFSEIDNLDRSRLVFKQIYTIVNNIAHNPLDEKYRRFNVNKLMSNFNYKSLLNFFYI
jgi:hypothetical protein